MSDYGTVASDERIAKTLEALKANNFDATVVDDLASAKNTVLSQIEDNARVFTGTSATLQEAGLDEALNDSPYRSVRNAYMAFYGQEDKAVEMKQIGSAADVAVSSVHAITEDGKLLIASASGSQLPAEAYGATKVIFVVGAQKLVKDLADGIRRIEEYSVPREDKRALAAYGVNTSFNKLLVFNKEAPGRVSVVIVRENVGY
jgi:hypothetical protein